jgi:hypothetical protein
VAATRLALLRRGVTEIRAVRAETTERYFNCRQCGARGEVSFRAVGDSGWQSEALLLDVELEDVHERAEEDLLVDAERVLHLIRCPTCKQRDSSYVRWAAIRVLAWFAIGLPLFFISHFYFLITAIGCTVGGLWQIWRERSRFKRADTARILRLKPGKHARLADAKPVHTLPVVAKPVERVAQRTAGDEPAFLRKD